MSRTISGVNGQISLNPATDNPTYVTGTIFAPGTTALYAPSGATWTITNTGSISAPNSGGIGVNVSSTGTLINGSSSGGSGYILGGSDGVLFNGAVGTVANFGTIKAAGDYSYGAFLTNGGAITNGDTGDTSALIAAYGTYVTGIRVDGGGTIHNFGTIRGATGSANGSYGIVSTGGGTIVNGASGSTAALITGSEEGIHLSDAAGVTTTVVNYGTISGPGLDAIRELSSGNLTVVNSGLLSGLNHAILFGSGTNRLIVHPGAVFQGDVESNSGGVLTIELATGSGTGTIGGFGSNFLGFNTLIVDSGAQWTITGSNTIGVGVTLTDSGTLTNSGTLIGGGALTVALGTMINTGSVGIDVALGTGGYLDNTSTGVIDNNGTGKAIFGGDATVVNDGRVIATGASGGYGYQGVYLGAGSVDNTGTITAFGNGIVFQGGGTITNSGTVSGGRWGATARGFTTIINSGTLYGASQGVVLSAGGYINNSNDIRGLNGIGIGGTSGTVVNSGAITGIYGPAISLGSGGTLTNTASGLISAGGIYTGVDISGAAGTVTNTGTITGYTGIVFSGTFNNTVTNGGTIAGSGGIAIAFSTGDDLMTLVPGALLIQGTVSGTAGSDTLQFASAASTGTLTGVAAAFTNFETLTINPGASWVLAGSNNFGNSVSLVDNGTLTIAGTVVANIYAPAGAAPITVTAAGSVSNGGAGPAIYAFSDTIVNRGTVTASGILSADGIRMRGGGRVNNFGLITGHYGVIGYGTLNIANSGTIGDSGSRNGVFLRGGGSVNNTGLIKGNVGIGGPVLSLGVTVTNSGTITGLNGISLSAFDTANATIIDTGTIIGVAGPAVQLGGGNDLMKFNPSTSIAIQGAVDGGAGTDTLEFASAASTGTVTGIGAALVGFETGTVDAGAAWVLTGDNTLGAGITLSNLGTLTVAGTLVNGGQLTGADYHGLRLAPGGTITNLAGGVINLASANYNAFDPVIWGLAGGPGTVNNFGTIRNGEIGIYLPGGGTVRNGATDNTTALIYAHEGILNGFDTNLTVVNYGTIIGNYAGAFGSHRGVDIADGVVVNGAPGSTAALIVGGDAVLFGRNAGTVVNFGTIRGTYAAADGVLMYYGNGGTVINAGTIIGSRDSIRFGTATRFGPVGNNLVKLYPSSVLIGGGVIAPGPGNVLELAAGASSGTVSGIATQYVGFANVTVDAGASWALTGTNTIGAGVTLTDSGTLTNSGILTTTGTGILLDGHTLINSGSVGAGVTMSGGAYLGNLAGGVITNATNAISGLGGANTVTNAGSIGGGISFAGTGGNLLILRQGYQLSGQVAASGGGNTLELRGSAGAPVTVDYNALSLTNFGTVLFGPGSYATLTIGNTAALPGTIAGFTTLHDTIDLPTLSDAGNDASASFDSVTNVLTVIGDNGTVQLQLDNEDYSGLTFVAQSDGGGGTKITISAGDTTPPKTTAASLTVAENAAATVIGIAAPSDPDNPAASLTVTVGTLPADGTVASGGTALTIGQVLSVAQLTALTFTPTANLFGATSTFDYTVADPARNSAAGSATLAIGPDNTVPTTTAASLTVAENAAATVIGIAAPSDPDNPAASLTVTVATLPSDGTVASGGTALTIGQVLSVAQLTALTFTPTANLFGATSTFDYTVADPAGNSAAGSATLAIVPVSTALFGFVFTYADDAASYTGTVAEDGSGGLTSGSRTVTDGSSQTLGTYTIFTDGVTLRAAGTVVIGRFTTGDASFIPNPSSIGLVDGSGGIGSEAATVTINGTNFGFSNHQEPALILSLPTVPAIPAPVTSDPVTNQLNQLYQEVLGRNVDSSGLATYSAALANGMSLAEIRQILAQSPEAQSYLNQLYNQIFDRDADAGGLATYTAGLINGLTLDAVKRTLGQSAEGQILVNQIYREVLGRDADSGGLDTYTNGLANGINLDGTRSTIAHSPEAQADLNALFQAVLGRPPGAAELYGMEDRLSVVGTTQQTLDTALVGAGSAGGYTTIAAGTGSATLTALPGTPTLFAFGDIAFGNDTIDRFDPVRDTIQLPHRLVADLATLQTETSSNAAGGSLITLNAGQSILITGVAPPNLGAANFQIA